MTDPTYAEIRKEADAAIELIRPLIARRDPMVQGLIVAELSAIWLAGNDDLIRDTVFDLHIKTMRDLTGYYVKRRREMS